MSIIILLSGIIIIFILYNTFKVLVYIIYYPLIFNKIVFESIRKKSHLTLNNTISIFVLCIIIKRIIKTLQNTKQNYRSRQKYGKYL